jgi:hypothetical protein
MICHFVTRRRIHLESQVLHSLYYSPDLNGAIKPEPMIWIAHVALEESTNSGVDSYP